jgi:hypothetical protein
MATTQKKWSDNMLRQFYAELRAQFGRHKFWQFHSHPGHIKKIQFKRFMDAFTVAFHVAPKSQLAWATTHQAKIGLCSKGKPQTYNQRNYMRNKLAAYDTGFIGKEYFADEVVFIGHFPVHGMGITALNAKIEEGLADAAEESILEFDI